MSETIYINHDAVDSGVLGVIFTQETRAVYTGAEAVTEDNAPIVAEFSRLCGVNFFLKEPEIPFYSVPYLEVFASDSQGGWFASTQGGSGGPVYYITPDRTAHLVAEDSQAVFVSMVTDPNWRQKYLPGSWPRLPEDQSGRKTLAETLELDQAFQLNRRCPHTPIDGQKNQS